MSEKLPMVRKLVFATAALLIACTVQAREPVADEQEILRVEAEVCRAFETGDVAALRRGLDPTFTLVDSRGNVTGLADNLAELERGDPVYEVFRNHGQTMRLYGDTAIVNGITSIKGRSGGTPFAADFRFTDTWVRRKDGWKLAASHASRIAGE